MCCLSVASSLAGKETWEAHVDWESPDGGQEGGGEGGLQVEGGSGGGTVLVMKLLKWLCVIAARLLLRDVRALFRYGLRLYKVLVAATTTP